MSEPGFYQSDAEEIRRVTIELKELMAELDAAYQRWEELESGLD